MISIISKFLLRLFGWRAIPGLPELKKYVLIGAPHTSNWDFVIAMLGALAIGLRFNWLAKHTLFKNPIGPLLKFFGGIPVDRTVRSSLIDKMTDMFNKREHLVLGITPEGTRSKTKYWKSGFYYIALGANVPIAFAYMDYAKNSVGIGETIVYPSGDINVDMEKIREFYKDKIGKNPEKQGEIRLFPKE